MCGEGGNGDGEETSAPGGKCLRDVLVRILNLWEKGIILRKSCFKNASFKNQELLINKNV